MNPSQSPRAGLLTAMAIQVLLSPWWLTGTVILTNMRPPLERPTSLDYGLRIVLIAVWCGLTLMLVFLWRAGRQHLWIYPFLGAVGFTAFFFLWLTLMIALSGA
jgi:hypothetical protein